MIKINDDDYEKKVSVIIPVYNSEEFLRNTLDSLLSQTIEHSKLEVILINDGSTDGSFLVCKEYSDIFDFIKTYDQENKGVSATRNRGIDLATGKYIMFLDSDDTLSPNCIEEVTSFFDEHFYETDLVTYHLDTFINGNRQANHYRYDYLNETGVFDLTEDIYALQTHMNICIKNGITYRFDTEMLLHEDQKFIGEVINEKMTIGYCQDAKYYYYRNDNGIMGSKLSPLYIFESTTGFYEDLFGKYEKVPRYFQALLVHDLNWKLRLNVLFPYHYEKRDYDTALNRLKKLLYKVDVDVIMGHPIMDFFHKIYFLKFRDTPLTPVLSDKSMSLLFEDVIISQKQNFEILINTIKIINGHLKIVGAVKSEFFDFSEYYSISLCKQNKTGIVSQKKLKLYDSAECYYRCKTKTNVFPGFMVYEPVEEDTKYFFKVSMEGFSFIAKSYYFFSECSISKKIPFMYGEDYMLTFCDKYFFLSKTSYPSFVERIVDSSNISDSSKTLLNINYDNDSEGDVWLYYDCHNVYQDNGLIQFRYDFHKDDGIKRFYVNSNRDNMEKLRGEFGDSVISFGSLRHKWLFLHSSKVLTAFIEFKNYNPFTLQEYEDLKHIINTEIIYLQHGVLHIDMPWKYAPGRIEADKIVVSSNMEKRYLENTGFDSVDVLPLGMARFENVKRSTLHKRRILFAPSWRSYLISENNLGEWIPSNVAFTGSVYYEKIQSLLNSRALSTLLEDNDLYMDFKLHPIFGVYSELFETISDRINIIDTVENESDYALFITDFSSYVYNFVFLQRNIIYFIPDYYEFKSGMGSYWNLTVPFEDAFGKLITEPGKLVTEIKRIVNNGFKPDSKYLSRMKSFFVPLENCCEKLYDVLTSGDVTSSLPNL